MPDSSPGSRLEYGREAFLRHHWLDAFRNLELADQDEPLEGPDLEQLGFAAHLSGHDDEGFAALERAHQWQLAAGDPVRAARVAIWLSLGLMNRGDVVREAAGSPVPVDCSRNRTRTVSKVATC